MRDLDLSIKSPLCFSSDGISYLGMQHFGGNMPDLYININGIWNHWQGETKRFTGKIFVAGNNISGLSKSEKQYSSFTITGDPVKCFGNIMSLLSYPIANMDEAVTYQIQKSAPIRYIKKDGTTGLPLNTLIVNADISDSRPDSFTFNINSFQELCKNDKDFNDIFDFTRMELTPHCFYKTFYGCDSLLQASYLPATVLAEHCYESMYENCKMLTFVPVLPGKILVDGCYENMFKSCPNLSLIKVLCRNVLQEEFSQSWLAKTAKNGMLVRGPEANWELNHSDSTLPEGWTLK